MRVKLDKLFIIDLEASCWAKRSDKPPNEHQEIIEIGICIFDTTSWKPTSKHQIVVRPTESTITQFCTDLTGWTQEKLEKSGIPFAGACEKLTSVYNSNRYPWASYGDFDRIAFERECNRKNVKYPFCSTHINLKTIFALHKKMSKGVGMKRALEMSGLELEGRHHSGMDDAWNIGRLLQHQGRF